MKTERGKGQVITTYKYDVMGRAEETKVTGGDGKSQITENRYDGLGRIEWTQGPDGLETHYAYPSQLITEVTRPGGATEITERYVDGRTKSVTGTGVVARHYTYGVDEYGNQWTEVQSGSEGSRRHPLLS